VALIAVAAISLGLSGAIEARMQVYGGTLVVAEAADVTSLDPTVSHSTTGAVFYAMCLQLYEVESNHGVPELFPVLAAAPPAISADRLTYTVQLRRGLLFNDGTPFDAQAVVTTYQRFVTYPGSTRASLLTSVDYVTTDGPYTVVFHLKHRDSTFEANMFVLSPTALATEGSNFAANPICVAPFMLDHWIPGVSLTLIKSPYYYKRAAIHLDKIVFQVISDSEAAFSALEAGDVQATGISTNDLAAAEKDPSLRVIQHPGLGWAGIIINIGNRNGCCNPLGNTYQNAGNALASSPMLRQAFEEAINRTALVKVADGGLFATICTPIPPANVAWFKATTIPCTPYDPKAARALVARSGVANPTAHLLVDGTGELVEAQVIQSDEAAVGINVVLDLTDNTTDVARLEAGTFDAALRGWPGDLDPFGQIQQFLGTTGDHNYSGYSNPRLDYVLTNAQKATEPRAQATDYRVAEQIIQADRPIIYLDDSTSFEAYRDNVTGIQLDPIGAPILNNAQFKQ
jgi:peptide/nickel transport system substrate-binding protein